MSTVTNVFSAWRTNPDLTLTLGSLPSPETLEAFKRDHPPAGSYPDWLEFFERYGAATLQVGEHHLAFLGFDRSMGPHILEEDGDVVNADGFMDFAVLTIETPDPVDVSFTFDTRKKLGGGVIARRDGEPERFAPSFSSFLEQIQAKIGNLEVLAQPHGGAR